MTDSSIPADVVERVAEAICGADRALELIAEVTNG